MEKTVSGTGVTKESEKTLNLKSLWSQIFRKLDTVKKPKDKPKNNKDRRRRRKLPAQRLFKCQTKHTSNQN